MIDKEPLEQRLHRYLDERDAERPPIGLDDRIIRMVRDEPRRRSVPTVRGQVFAAGAIAVLAVGLAAGVAYLRGHSTANTGPAPVREPALSIGTNGGGDWIVVRGIDPGSPTRQPNPDNNALYYTPDGGQTWQDRLHFSGIYDGMSWTGSGQTGVVWTFEMTTPCGATAQSCRIMSSELVTVYSTTDAGRHWTAHSPQAFGDFALIYFRGLSGWVLSSPAVAVGQSGPSTQQLSHTRDGGATWTVVANPPALGGPGGIFGYSAGVGQTNLEFADENHGWLATSSDTGPGLLETTDGGKTWHSVSVSQPVAAIGKQTVMGYPILLDANHALLPVFFGQRTGPNDFAISSRYVYSSADGGKTWANPLPLNANGVQPTGDEWQAFYLDAQHWWFTAINNRSAGEPVPQAGPAVARTTDGGKTWVVYAGKDAPTILQMTFTDADHGWALAITGPDNTNILLRTTDGGAHWHQVQLP
jgi:photosystem II stability/assembly factor-like uncharacterized protein